MTLYVRIPVTTGNLGEIKTINISDASTLNVEDHYEQYDGCRDCGYPLDRAEGTQRVEVAPGQRIDQPLDFAFVKGKGGCPHCQVGKEYYNGQRQVPISGHNPQVRIGEDGSLTVLHFEDAVGFCPKGAWLSYRSD